MLRAMTVNAARALGLEQKVGSLAPGKNADLILVRLDDINTMPMNDPVATLLLHAHPGNVDTVMVAGQILKRGGRLVADLARARRLMAESQAYIVDAIDKTVPTLPGGYKGD